MTPVGPRSKPAAPATRSRVADDAWCPSHGSPARPRRLRVGPAIALATGLGAAALLAAAPAEASGFSCGSRVVTRGMFVAQVRAACGEPTQVLRTSILRRPVVWRHGRPWFVGDDVVAVPVETWVYNFGTQRLVRKLRFVDGELDAIETLGYGWHEPE